MCKYRWKRTGLCGGIIGWMKKAGNLNNAYNIGTVESSSNGTDKILTKGSVVEILMELKATRKM